MLPARLILPISASMSAAIRSTCIQTFMQSSTGPIRLKTKLNISPGDRDISDRLRLAGTFHIPTGYFTNEKLQTRIDNLSLRGLGEPKLIGKEDVNTTT